MSADAEATRAAAVRLAAVAGLVLLAHVIDAHWRPAAARVAVAAVVFGALAFRRSLLRSRWPWVLLTATIAWVLFTIPYRLGNHHYVLGYTGLAMILCSGRDDREFLDDLGANLRWFLVAIMGIAVLQRLIEPQFVDGSYLGLMLARGQFFRFLYALCDSCQALADENVTRMTAAELTDPSTASPVALTPPFAHFALVARGFGVLILAVEIWIGAAFAFFKSPWVRHTALLPFVVALGFTRSEFVFASILALIGLSACSVEERRLRDAYTLLAIVLTACVFLFPVETGS